MTNRLESLVQGDGGETAALKGTIADGSQRGGQHIRRRVRHADAGQFIAAGECTRADGGQAVGQHHCRELRTTLERTIVDDCHAIRDGDARCIFRISDISRSLAGQDGIPSKSTPAIRHSILQ